MHILLVAPAHSLGLAGAHHMSANLVSPVCDVRARSPQSYRIKSAGMVDSALRGGAPQEIAHYRMLVGRCSAYSRTSLRISLLAR